MGGVDLLQKFQENYADDGLQLTSHPVTPTSFFLRERSRGRVDEFFTCSLLACER